VIQLGSADFPPLPTQEKKPGYTDAFKRYSREDIVGVISGIKDFNKPEISADSKIVLPEPNTELEVTKPFPKRTTAADIAKKLSDITPENPKPNSSPSSPSSANAPATLNLSSAMASNPHDIEITASSK